MAPRRAAHVGLSFALCALFSLVVESVTPVEKVIELLESLSKKVDEEGKAEAAAYDKYACFCKEQVDNKQYAIEKSDAKIKKLTSEIDKLAADIAGLDGEVQDLGMKIGQTLESISELDANRATYHANYVKQEADAAGAIDACKRAIAALTESKAAMGGKTELNAALAQVRSYARLAIAVGSTDRRLKALEEFTQPGQAYESEYHSNHIIELLQDLLKKFEGIKAQLDQDEFDNRVSYESLKLDSEDQVKFMSKERDEKQALSDEKREEKEAREGDKHQEMEDMHSDQNFREVLTADCAEKARLWDQRSITRAQELTAIAQAVESLKQGVAPNWEANKKLVGIQRKTQVIRAASFLQVRSRSREVQAAEEARVLLADAGKRLRSAALSTVALRISVSEDHFVKVRTIIKDLLKRLKEQADEEATQKGFCDERMSAAVKERDARQSAIEDSKAMISKKNSQIKQNNREIADLSQQIADNKKALQEATDLRTKENIENTKTVDDATLGKQAVEQAMEVLNKFYTGAASLLQYVPPNSDREGLTVSDRAPEIFDAEYQGSQDASKGILGMLEVILTDFDRTIATVTEQEADAQKEFDDFKQVNEKDTLTKEGTVARLQADNVDLEAQLVDHEVALRSDTDLHQASLQELQKLEAMCVDGEETYEERVAKRKAEIEALKQAHDILEDWNK